MAAASIAARVDGLRLARRKDDDARGDEGGRKVGRRRRRGRTIALTPCATAKASSSRAKAAFAASPASTKRMSARPLLSRMRGGFDDELQLAARRRKPGRREHDPFMRRGAPALARFWRPLAADRFGCEARQIEAGPDDPAAAGARREDAPARSAANCEETMMRAPSATAASKLERGLPAAPRRKSLVTSGSLSLRQAASATQAAARDRAWTRPTCSDSRTRARRRALSAMASGFLLEAGKGSAGRRAPALRSRARPDRRRPAPARRPRPARPQPRASNARRRRRRAAGRSAGSCGPRAALSSPRPKGESGLGVHARLRRERARLTAAPPPPSPRPDGARLRRIEARAPGRIMRTN